MNIFLDGTLMLFINRGFRPSLKDGEPALFLVTPTKVQLFEEPTTFLLEHYVGAGATPSEHTWQKAAYGLKTWLGYLQAMEKKDWRDACEQDRIDFRDAMLGAISPHTGERYGTKGVRDTMAMVRTFYTFARGKNWYEGDLAEGWSSVDTQRNALLSQDALAHTRSSAVKKRDRALPKGERNDEIRALSVNDLRTLLNYAGPQAGQRDGDQRYCRDRLICDIGVFVGLRVTELVNLTTLQFLNLNPDPSAPYVSQTLTIKGKGRVLRPVAIPNWLVLDAIEYITTEREQALKASKRRLGVSLPTQLFLGHPNSNSRRGKPIGVDAIQRMIERACKACGLVMEAIKINAESGEKRRVTIAKYSPHDLRHTCAVLMYHAEVKNGNPEPWKKIQAQLGHKHLTTTIDTYLAHVELFNDQPGLFSLQRALGRK